MRLLAVVHCYFLHQGLLLQLEQPVDVLGEDKHGVASALAEHVDVLRQQDLLVQAVLTTGALQRNRLRDLGHHAVDLLLRDGGLRTAADDLVSVSLSLRVDARTLCLELGGLQVGRGLAGVVARLLHGLQRLLDALGVPDVSQVDRLDDDALVLPALSQGLLHLQRRVLAV